ncbi:MAG: Coenzyme F420 hydrogenase/dehydrogenase, beta subunit C-terminal domain [Pseudomonadota bacterium]
MSFAPSPTLSRVSRGSLCTGCGGCAAIAPGAITMHLAEPGYLRPQQSAPIPAETERRIREACPGLGLRQVRDGRRQHRLWGPYVAMYTGHATDPALRRNGASGAALSAVLVELLESGRVDEIVQIRDDPKVPIGNRTVISKTSDDVFAAAGSRYAPSSPLANLPAYLDTGRRYAFVGKPCDVSAMSVLRRQDPLVAERFPYLVSFFCAGVPSQTGARELLAKMGVGEEEVSAFRYRGDGWPGYATATTPDGRKYRMSYADSWGGVLSRHVQFRCKICPDGTGGFADIVSADAWETDEKGYPLFEERDGISLVVSRTERGEEVVQSAVTRGVLTIEPFDPAGLTAIQPGQTQRRRYALARLLALRILGRPAPRYRNFHLLWNARRAGLKQNAKNFAGTVRRALLGRL